MYAYVNVNVHIYIYIYIYIYISIICMLHQFNMLSQLESTMPEIYLCFVCFACMYSYPYYYNLKYNHFTEKYNF